MQILYHHIIRMIGNGIHVTNIFTGLGWIPMFTCHSRHHRGDQLITGNKYECIFKVRTHFWSCSWIAYRCIQLEIEIFLFLNSIGDQALILRLSSLSNKLKSSQSHKASFCLEDTECLPGRRQKYDCKTEQAISPGCADIYVSGIDCQVSPIWKCKRIYNIDDAFQVHKT